MPDALTPGLAALVDQGRRLCDARRVEDARASAAAFCAYALRDEQTGRPVRMAPFHPVWHHLAGEHDRLVVWAHVEGGKSQQLSVGRVLWALGRDPTLRCVILSNTYHQAARFVRAVARYIGSSPETRMVFPGLRRGDRWTAGSLTVARGVISKDPSVQAVGVHGNILGARVDLLIVDDVLDYENTRTASQRDAAYEWFHATFDGRLTARARVVAVGQAWHPDDLLHRLAREGYVAHRFPVCDPAGEPLWPARWPRERIERARGSMPPLEFARQLMCAARDDAEARFKRAWIDVALQKGAGRHLCESLAHRFPDLARNGSGGLPAGWRAFTGVDLGVQVHSGADRTALHTLLVDPKGNYETVWIESGRWHGHEIVERIVEAHRRFRSVVMVENNAGQQWIVEFARQHRAAVPILAFTTGRNKADPAFGVESLAAELAGGRWTLPSGNGGGLHPEVQALVDEMLYYDPRAHCGDRLMSMWFAREAARRGEQKPARPAQYKQVDWTRR